MRLATLVSQPPGDPMACCCGRLLSAARVRAAVSAHRDYRMIKRQRLTFHSSASGRMVPASRKKWPTATHEPARVGGADDRRLVAADGVAGLPARVTVTSEASGATRH
jgi:hypothetical protein